ncbi:hypothetical protein [Chlamydiifrater volucris]|uniref:hypothetical protein n=1 Tax=Chlamydiifrater volucris TaxID=2681470 RepID=UPI001BCB32B3|nr:hypothetical protein [Chlamydiifrater volucris]
MSISNPSESKSRAGLGLPSVSIGEKIQETLNIILTIVQSTQIKHPPSPLYSQIISLKKEGFSLPLISQAMVVSKISIATILGENRSLTSQELDLVLASCRDLTEASGSGSSSQSTTQSMKRKQLEEEISRSPSPKRRRLPQEGILQTEDVPTEPVAPQHAAEESLRAQSLNCLLVTIMKNKGRIESYQSMCPRKNPMQKEDEHQCELCVITKNIIKGGKHLLVFQLKQLMKKTNEKIVLNALLTLYEEGKLSELENISRFSHLEIAHLVKECNLEAVFPTSKANISKVLNLYQKAKDVVALGIRHPLTELIIQLWNSTMQPVETDTTILVIGSNEEITPLSANIFLPTLSSVLQYRPLIKENTGGKRYRPLTPGHSTFLAKMTIATLQAIKDSSQGAPYIVSTNFVESAFSWGTVCHVIGLLLSSSTEWMLHIPTSQLCIGSREDIRFSKEECLMISESKKKFAKNNHIHPYTKALVPRNIQLPKESCLLSTLEMEAQTTIPSSTKSVRLVPKSKPSSADKKSKDEKKTEQLITSSLPTETIESSLPTEQIETRDFLSLLLQTILGKKEDESSPVPCPNNPSKQSQHECDLCTSVKYFVMSKCVLVQQLGKLLYHSTEQKLLEILSLPRFGNCVKNRLLSPIELILAIDKCEIGEAVRLPNESFPTSNLDVYLSIDEVVHSGLSNPLTTAITTLWGNPAITPFGAQSLDCLLVSRGAISCVLFKESLQKTFSSLNIQVLQSDGARSPKEKISPSLVKFLSKAAFITLHNLLYSPLGIRFTLLSDRSEKMLSWETVKHACGLILAVQAGWRVVLPPNVISPGYEEIGFSLVETSPLFSLFRNFVAYYGLNEGDS